MSVLQFYVVVKIPSDPTHHLYDLRLYFEECMLDVASSDRTLRAMAIFMSVSVLQSYALVVQFPNDSHSLSMIYFEVLMLEVAQAKPFPAPVRKSSPMYVTSLQTLRNAEKLISTGSQVSVSK